jgi:hypothetical protein
VNVVDDKPSVREERRIGKLQIMAVARPPKSLFPNLSGTSSCEGISPAGVPATGIVCTRSVPESSKGQGWTSLLRIA